MYQIADTEQAAKAGALTDESTRMEQAAQVMTVENDDDYARTGEVIKTIKTMTQTITDFWEPMRSTAYATYKGITDAKKAMLDPLEKAEKTLKSKMSAYIVDKERRAQEEAERLRALAKAEAEKKMTEAFEAQQRGDLDAMDAAMAEAEVMSEATIVPQVAETKTAGVSRKKTYTVKVVDAAAVPVEVAGVVIRPIDEKALLKLAKATDGQIKVPGVVFETAYEIAVRK